MINKISSTEKQHFVAIVVGIICALGYGYLAVQSNQDSGIELFDFLGSYWFISAVVLLYWFYLFDNKLPISYGAVIFWAVVFRLIGLWGSPILEDDFYRYLLDGCVFVSTGSPYGITPESLFQSNALSEECRYALTWVNNPDLPTIYGPVLQYIFALAHIVSPTNIKFVQFVLILFDIGVILILCRFASARNLMLYAWNPLIIKEIAFTAHPDIVGVFFLMAAFAASYHHRTAVAAIMIAMACASKIFAILLFPYFLYKIKFKYALLSIGVLVGIYAPFLVQGYTDLFVVGVFAEHWQFNATVFQLFLKYFPDMVSRLMCTGIFATWWFYYFWRHHHNQVSGSQNQKIPRVDWIFGLFFLLSPVLNAWYLIWLLPFAVIYPSFWAWTAAMAISLSYITGLNLIESSLHAYEIDQWAYTLEITLVGLALLFDWRIKAGKTN